MVLGVRGVFEGVVVARQAAFFDGADFFADGDHGRDEAVEFGFVFGFGRLNHQGAGHRKRHRGRVKTVVHQAFGNVGFRDAAGGFERAQVDDAFVGDAPGLAGVQNGVVRGEAGGEIVGVENRRLGGAAQPFAAHQGDVHPRNHHHAGGTKRRGAHGVLAAIGAVGFAGGEDGVVGQVGGEMRGDTNRPHAGAAAAVRDGEGFVQIHVADVGADVRRAGQADLRVEVRSVHIDLPAVAVDDVADFADFGFKDAVRGRIGNHQRGELVGVGGGFVFEVLQVDVAVRVAVDGDNRHAAHVRRGGVGAVGGFGNQADVALTFTARGVVAGNRDHAGIFALRAGIGLQADGVKAGDGAQLRAQAVQKGERAGDVFAWREGVGAVHFGPR